MKERQRQPEDAHWFHPSNNASKSPNLSGSHLFLSLYFAFKEAQTSQYVLGSKLARCFANVLRPDKHQSVVNISQKEVVSSSCREARDCLALIPTFVSLHVDLFEHAQSEAGLGQDLRL